MNEIINILNDAGDKRLFLTGRPYETNHYKNFEASLVGSEDFKNKYNSDRFHIPHLYANLLGQHPEHMHSLRDISDVRGKTGDNHKAYNSIKGFMRSVLMADPTNKMTYRGRYDEVGRIIGGFTV